MAKRKQASKKKSPPKRKAVSRKPAPKRKVAAKAKKAAPKKRPAPKKAAAKKKAAPKAKQAAPAKKKPAPAKAKKPAAPKAAIPPPAPTPASAPTPPMDSPPPASLQVTAIDPTQAMVGTFKLTVTGTGLDQADAVRLMAPGDDGTSGVHGTILSNDGATMVVELTVDDPEQYDLEVGTVATQRFQILSNALTVL